MDVKTVWHEGDFGLSTPLGARAADFVGRSGFVCEAALEEDEDGGFLWREVGEVGGDFDAGLLFQIFCQFAFHVGLNDARVDVAFAADGGGVAEAGCDSFDRVENVFLGLGLAGHVF